jgi:DNA-binding NarL/FixJ family response regulator
VTILIIESRESLRQALRNWLEVVFSKHLILEAADPEEALAVAQQNWPQVVIMDVGFPRVDDLEYITHLKSVLPDAQVVVLSNYESETYRSLVIAYGANAYVQKKEMLNELKPALMTLLSSVEADS